MYVHLIATFDAGAWWQAGGERQYLLTHCRSPMGQLAPVNQHWSIWTLLMQTRTHLGDILDCADMHTSAFRQTLQTVAG